MARNGTLVVSGFLIIRKGEFWLAFSSFSVNLWIQTTMEDFRIVVTRKQELEKIHNTYNLRIFGPKNFRTILEKTPRKIFASANVFYKCIVFVGDFHGKTRVSSYRERKFENQTKTNNSNFFVKVWTTKILDAETKLKIQQPNLLMTDIVMNEVKRVVT